MRRNGREAPIPAARIRGGGRRSSTLRTDLRVLASGSFVHRGAVIRATRLSNSRQVVEQRLCLFEVPCVEAFGEPAVNWGEEIAGFGAPTLLVPEAG